MIQILQTQPHPTNHSRQHPQINILLPLEQIPPHSASQHSIALDQPLVTSQNQPPPLLEQILQIPLPERARCHTMAEIHLTLRLVEEMVDELGMPVLVDVLVQTPEADDEEVEVEHGHLRPGAECREELEICFVYNHLLVLPSQDAVYTESGKTNHHATSPHQHRLPPRPDLG